MNETLLLRRETLLKLMIKGATLQAAAEEMTKDITDLFEREKAISRIRRDWENRKRWINLVIRLNETTFLSEIAASIQEASRFSWLEYAKGKTSTARIAALRTIMMGKYRLGMLLMKAGIIEEATQHIEQTMTIAGTPFDADPNLKKALTMEYERQHEEKIIPTLIAIQARALIETRAGVHAHKNSMSQSLGGLF